jgi:hypothetical protein
MFFFNTVNLAFSRWNMKFKLTQTKLCLHRYILKMIEYRVQREYSQTTYYSVLLDEISNFPMKYAILKHEIYVNKHASSLSVCPKGETQISLPIPSIYRHSCCIFTGHRNGLHKCADYTHAFIYCTHVATTDCAFQLTWPSFLAKKSRQAHKRQTLSV